MSLGVRAEQTRLMSCKLEGCTFYDAGELTDNVVYYLRETMDMLVDLCSRGVGIRVQTASESNPSRFCASSQCPTRPWEVVHAVNFMCHLTHSAYVSASCSVYAFTRFS